MDAGAGQGKANDTYYGYGYDYEDYYDYYDYYGDYSNVEPQEPLPVYNNF